MQPLTVAELRSLKGNALADKYLTKKLSDITLTTLLTDITGVMVTGESVLLLRYLLFLRECVMGAGVMIPDGGPTKTAITDAETEIYASVTYWIILSMWKTTATGTTTLKDASAGNIIFESSTGNQLEQYPGLPQNVFYSKLYAIQVGAGTTAVIVSQKMKFVGQ